MLIDENKSYKMIIDLVQVKMGLAGVFYAKVKGVSLKIFLGASLSYYSTSFVVAISLGALSLMISFCCA